MRTRTRGWLAAALLALVATTTGCNGGGDPTAETTSSAPPATTEPTTAPPPTISDVGRRLLEDPDAVLGAAISLFQSRPDDLAVLRGYIRAEQAWIRAGMAPVNAEHPDLLSTTRGELLVNRQAALRDLQRDGDAYMAPKELRVVPRRIVPTATTAVIDLCYVEQLPQYTVATGEIVGEDLFSEDATATMELIDGQWRLTSRRQNGDTRDGSSCAG